MLQSNKTLQVFHVEIYDPHRTSVENVGKTNQSADYNNLPPILRNASPQIITSPTQVSP